MIKNIIYNIEARNKLKKGVDILANAVKVTLGPRGRNVVIQKSFGSPQITKDGVTVAKEIELQDPVENLGAQMVKEVASKTSDTAGDGTTTATLLAQCIINEGLKSVEAGSNPIELKRGIDLAVKVVVKDLRKQSEQIGDDNYKIKQIATISANNDESIGDLICTAFTKVGKDGVITIEDSKGIETSVDILEGMHFDRGYQSSYFITNTDNMTVELEDSYILIYDKKISTLKEILPILESIKNNPLLIICEEVEGEALATLIINKIRGILKIAVVKSPGFGDRKKSFLEDIAILTGAVVISEEIGININNKDIMNFLGKAGKITIDKENTIIVNGNGDRDQIDHRIRQLKYQISSSKSDYDTERLQERLAKLAGGIAVLYVGAPSEIEMKEKKDRVDDALHATRAAIEEGILSGGGLAYIRAIKALDNIKGANKDHNISIEIIKKALLEPLIQIVNNSGGNGNEVVLKVLEKNCKYGYDAKTREYKDMMKNGIVDPTKVTRVALENASSVAGMLITTECVITEIKDKDKITDNNNNNNGIANDIGNMGSIGE